MDLSLRNPLNQDFVGPLLKKLVEDPDIKRVAGLQPDSDLAWNLRHLSDSQLQERLVKLFSRLATIGHRVTVRELWIWAYVSCSAKVRRIRGLHVPRALVFQQAF